VVGLARRCLGERGRALAYGETVNSEHLELLRSAGWRELLRDFVIPFALERVDFHSLGDDVLEIGSGPGLTTELLCEQVARLTALELDAVLAGELDVRLGSRVEVVEGDATDMPFESGRFSAVVSFTMLHHVPTVDMQDRLFAEVRRVLRSGGIFVANDSVASEELAALHDGDVYNPVDPSSVGERLHAAGFTNVSVRDNAFGWAAHAYS
jgi:SAM-dependent methyltransferase